LNGEGFQDNVLIPTVLYEKEQADKDPELQ
jgi:hypothetical protein